MADASFAADQVERLWRLGEAHGDRKVVGGGAIPLAPANVIQPAGRAPAPVKAAKRSEDTSLK
jgi:hypothetical protein